MAISNNARTMRFSAVFVSASTSFIAEIIPVMLFFQSAVSSIKFPAFDAETT